MADESRRTPQLVERLAATFAMEYLTGHFRPIRDDERRTYEQLKVVMLAFAAQIQRQQAEVIQQLPPTWQPIESAPKDGTRVMAILHDGSPYRAWQYEDGDDRRTIGIASWTDHNGGGWVSFWPGTPTHWQPLPALPASPAPRPQEEP